MAEVDLRDYVEIDAVLAHLASKGMTLSRESVASVLPTQPSLSVDAGPRRYNARMIEKACRAKFVEFFEGESAKAEADPPDLAGMYEIDVRALSESAIYFLLDATGKVLYVGQSVNVASRVAEHRQHKIFERVRVLPCAAQHLDEVEAAFIAKIRPPLNRAVPDGEWHVRLGAESCVSWCPACSRDVVADVLALTR